METPPKYKQYLNQGICDEQMLSDVIYSYNKRAKNHRDKSNEYRKCRYDKYDNEGKSLEKIAQELQISRSTIATHTMNIYGKRCVNSRVELLVRRINELEALINEKWNSRGTN